MRGSIGVKSAQDPGFTLIELLVVVSILAILTAILFPVFALVAPGSALKTKRMHGPRRVTMGG
jgi:prepilin-type N-terminal cleavage/methylation domain-containing protein